MINKVVTIQSTQTIFDLALQLEGDADKEFTVIADNPEIENLNSDPTGVVATYDINNTFAQKYYISKGIEISNKPQRYKNQVDGFLLCENGDWLTQENGYRILL